MKRGPVKFFTVRSSSRLKNIVVPSIHDVLCMVVTGCEVWWPRAAYFRAGVPLGDTLQTLLLPLYERKSILIIYLLIQLRLRVSVFIQSWETKWEI